MIPARQTAKSSCHHTCSLVHSASTIGSDKTRRCATGIPVKPDGRSTTHVPQHQPRLVSNTSAACTAHCWFFTTKHHNLTRTLPSSNPLAGHRTSQSHPTPELIATVAYHTNTHTDISLVSGIDSVRCVLHAESACAVNTKGPGWPAVAGNVTLVPIDNAAGLPSWQH